MIFFKDFIRPVPQNQVDSLYEALKPTMELAEHWGIISPAEISEAVHSGELNPYDRVALLEGIRKKLGVSLAIVISVFPLDNQLAANIEVVDTASGRTLQTRSEQKMHESSLRARVRADVFGMLLPSSPQH